MIKLTGEARALVVRYRYANPVRSLIINYKERVTTILVRVLLRKGTIGVGRQRCRGRKPLKSKCHLRIY